MPLESEQPRADALAALEVASRRFPDQRLCQIIANALFPMGIASDIFYYTDEELHKALTEYYRE